ncbi:MAG TPA: protein kinase [Thermoanaerobaculia bacterium]
MSSADDSTLRFPDATQAPLVEARYRLEEPIGKGAFGQVFRARDEMLGRTVAFKNLGPSGSSRFLDEARAVAKLDHPHIVPIYDAGVSDGNAFLVMKLIDGFGLERLIAAAAPMPRERVEAILRQVALALDHAHRKGIVHRDVKPSNILIEVRGESDHAWLADFGIAKEVALDTSREGAFAGTPAYMAPEQITGRRVDARADLFALGCVAFEMLTGRRAFAASGVGEVLYRIVHDEPEGLDELDVHAGERLANAVRRALAKSPDDRFASASEFAEAVAGRLRVAPLTRSQEPLSWDGRQILMIEGLCKRYTKPVLDHLDLTIERGSIYALLGRNGAGKSTLLRTVLGLYRRDAGRVLLFGRDPQAHDAKLLNRIGYVPESLTLYDTMTVGELVRLLPDVYASWDHALAYRLLARYELPLDTKVRTFSRGMRTKVSLLAALAHRPELLVLDDPTLGLDAVILDEFFDTIREVSRNEGTTVLLASHNIDDVARVATHVGFLGRGKIVYSEELASLRKRAPERSLKDMFVSFIRREQSE